MAETPEEIAYDVAVRAMDRQGEVLASLRARAGTVVSAAALVASFLGVPALRTAAHGFLDAAGIVALVGVLLLSLAILLPWRMTFRLSPTILLEDHAYPSPPSRVEDMQAFLARSLEGHHDANEVTLRKLNAAFQVACAFLIAEALVWIFGI